MYNHKKKWEIVTYRKETYTNIRPPYEVHINLVKSVRVKLNYTAGEWQLFSSTQTFLSTCQVVVEENQSIDIVKYSALLLLIWHVSPRKFHFVRLNYIDWNKQFRPSAWNIYGNAA